MRVSDVPISKIKPYEGNPRKNEAAIEKVAESIKQFGFRQPIVVDDSFVVLVGHTRLEAAKLIGLPSVPVHVASGLTESQRRAYRIADNKVAEFSAWDEDLLAFELSELKALGLEDLPGFSDSEFAELAGQVPSADFPEIASERGDVATRTFILHVDQVPVVEAAISRAATADGASLNKNGNGLALICEDYIANSERH